MKPHVGVNAKINLPNLDNRVQIVVDSLTTDDDSPHPDEHIERPLRDLDDDVDISTAARVVIEHGQDRVLDADVGLKIHSTDVEPFVKFRGKQLLFKKRIVVRLTQFLFWVSDDGFGETTRLDIEAHCPRRRFIRSTTEATYSEISAGVELAQTLTWYKILDPDRSALGVTLGADAETDPDVFTEFSSGVKYRRKLHRDWLFFEVEPRARFPEERDYNFSPELHFRFDIYWGHADTVKSTPVALRW